MPKTNNYPFPFQYGLYGSFLGCFIYIFLGSSKDVPVGPTAIAALLVAQTANGVWQRAVLLTFLTGIIEVLMGVLQLGFLIDFVSGPVSAGFTSAVSLIILTSQMKDIFGIKTTGSTFLEMWISIIGNIQNCRIGDTLLGFGCIVVLLGMRLMANVQIGPKENKNWWQKGITNTIWLIGTARNAVLVVVCGAIGAYVVNEDYFLLIGDIPAGMPNFQPPPFSMEAVVENGTIIHPEESFSEMVSNLGSGLIVVPLISLLENMAVVTTFGKKLENLGENSEYN